MSHEDMILKCLESKGNSDYIRKSVLFMLNGGKISHEMSLYAINKKNEICGVWQDGNYKKREKMTFAKFKNILRNGAKV